MVKEVYLSHECESQRYVCSEDDSQKFKFEKINKKRVEKKEYKNFDDLNEDWLAENSYRIQIISQAVKDERAQ